MNEERGQLSPEQERALGQRVRELPDPVLDPAVRAALKRGFVEGSLERAGTERRRWQRWAWSGLAAAAAILLLLWNLVPPTDTGWTVVAMEGSVEVDGAVLADTGAVQEALVGGGRVTAARDLVVGLGDRVLLQLVGGTTIRLPEAGADEFAIGVDRGELRVMTGPDFVADGFSVSTEDGRVLVTGTIFSVMCDDAATCVCVLEGSLSVGADRSSMDPVSVGERKVMFRDGSEPLFSPSAPPHREGLEAFRAGYAEAVGRR